MGISFKILFLSIAMKLTQTGIVFSLILILTLTFEPKSLSLLLFLQHHPFYTRISIFKMFISRPKGHLKELDEKGEQDILWF